MESNSITKQTYIMKTKLLSSLLKVTSHFTLLLIILLGSNGLAWGQTTMAHFGLNTNYNPDVDIIGGTTGSQSGLTIGNSSGTCEGSNYAYCNGSNDYLQINLNTTGYSGAITISCATSTMEFNRNKQTRLMYWNFIRTSNADNNTTYE